MVVAVDRDGDASILLAQGVLDSSTYRVFRDAVIQAALDEPRAVIVDVDDLAVPSPSAWTVFSSARWHVSIWPDTPIILACSDIKDQRVIETYGVTRHVPLYPTRDAALVAASDYALPGRRRGRARLPNTPFSVGIARTMIHNWLTAWSRDRSIAVAGTIATVFVENVLEHTDSAAMLTVEYYQDTVIVAVEDSSHQPAIRHEQSSGCADNVSGLAIVSVLCRAWGSTPTPSGKTVWALVGAENQL